MEQGEIRNIGWRVTMAGMGINLALGVLYAWSVIKAKIPAQWNWTDFEKTLPYSVACLVFAFTMIFAGRAQDRYGPRWVALIGGIAVGAGCIIASFASSVKGFTLGFGVLAGAGIGMGYAAATPAAVKWFPPRRTGLIAGLVVAGFGVASVYISPLARTLIAHYSVGTDTGPGVHATLLIFGIGFLIAVGILSQLLAVPPAGWKPAAPVSAAKAAAPAAEIPWQKMLATPQFYLLWIMYAFAAGAGLMIIGSLSSIVSLQAGVKDAFLFVAILAIGNAGGRIAAGSLSDIIGRRNTMMIFFLCQAVLMFLLRHATFARGPQGDPTTSAIFAFIVLALLLGANYGANLALFPAVTKDYFGLKNFGVNYGWVFTAWGVGGLVLAQISGRVYDLARVANKAELIKSGMGADLAAKAAKGNYNTAYLIACICLIVAALIALLVKAPAARTQAGFPVVPAPQSA